MKIGEKIFINPLFKDMNHPKQDRVGLLLPLTCGHNGRPTEVETLTLAMHLEAAGFATADDDSSSRDYQSSGIDNIPVRQSQTPSQQY